MPRSHFARRFGFEGNQIGSLQGGYGNDNVTFGKRRSANSVDHMRSDAALDVTASKSMRQGFSRLRCRFFQARRIADLDFIPQRGSLTIGNRSRPRRGGPAFVIHAFDRNFRKSRGCEFLADRRHIVIAMRDAGHEARRIFWKDPRQRFRYDIGEFVFGDSIPHIEKEMAAPLEDAARLAITLDLIAKEQRAELAGDDIKALILKRQTERVGLAPGDATIISLPLRRAI